MASRWPLLFFAVPAACTVGPDYKGPPVSAVTATERGTFVRATDPALSDALVVKHWWESLRDPILSGLIRDALAQNPEVDVALARVRQAQAMVRARSASNLPNGGLNASYVHADLPGVELGPSAPLPDAAAQTGAEPLDFFSAGFAASWELDLFGSNRRTDEQGRAELGSSRAALADAQVALSARVAEAYVAFREAQLRAALLRAQKEVHDRVLALMHVRLAGGSASEVDLVRVQADVNEAAAQAAAIESDGVVQRDQLAVLTGREPGALDALLAGGAPVPLPPASVSIGDPAALIANRPDVRRAERALAARTAGVGVERAKLFPTVRFFGLLGIGGNSSGHGPDIGDVATILAPRLDWSFLNVRRTRALVARAQAQRDEAEATYRASVLGALQDAESSLQRFGSMRRQLAAAERGEALAVQAAQLAAYRRSAGSSDTIEQLDMELQRLKAAARTEYTRTQFTSSFIAVQKAFGLGWSDPRQASSP